MRTAERWEGGPRGEDLRELEGKRSGLFYDVAYDYCVGEFEQRLKEAGRNVTVGQLAKVGDRICRAESWPERLSRTPSVSLLATTIRAS